MREYLRGGVTLLAHDGCAYLAESYSVSPARSVEYDA